MSLKHFPHHLAVMSWGVISFPAKWGASHLMGSHLVPIGPSSFLGGWIWTPPKQINHKETTTYQNSGKLNTSQQKQPTTKKHAFLCGGTWANIQALQNGPSKWVTEVFFTPINVWSHKPTSNWWRGPLCTTPRKAKMTMEKKNHDEDASPDKKGWSCS